MEVHHLRCLDGADERERDVLSDVIEEAHAVTKEQRSDVDIQLVHQTRRERLLRRARAVMPISLSPASSLAIRTASWMSLTKLNFDRPFG